MATATLNPLFISIHGRIGSVVFYVRGNKQCVRSYVIPANPRTVSQMTVRERFAIAIRLWQNMSAAGKYKFRKKAAGLNMSGYNLYISEYMKEKSSSGSISRINKFIPERDYLPPVQGRIPSVSYTQREANTDNIAFAAFRTDSG